MRLTIINKTGRPDADIRPYIELAESLSTAKGKVELTVRQTKQGSRRAWRGWCEYHGKVRRILICIPRGGEGDGFKPFTRDTLGYFRQHAIQLNNPYRIDTREELLVYIATHEFGHLKKRGQAARRSRAELFCEDRVGMALDLFRSEKGRAFIAQRKQEIAAEEQSVVQRAKSKKAERRSPEAKRAKLEAAQRRWTTKAKRAATALKKIARQLRRLEKAEATQ